MTKEKTNNRKYLESLGQLTLPQILSKQGEVMGDSGAAIRAKSYGVWERFSWSEYARYAKQVALGLKSLGLNRGDNIGLILDNDPEWLFSELGAHSPWGGLLLICLHPP